MHSQWTIPSSWRFVGALSFSSSNPILVTEACHPFWGLFSSPLSMSMKYSNSSWRKRLLPFPLFPRPSLHPWRHQYLFCLMLNFHSRPINPIVFPEQRWKSEPFYHRLFHARISSNVSNPPPFPLLMSFPAFPDQFSNLRIPPFKRPAKSFLPLYLTPINNSRLQKRAFRLSSESQAFSFELKALWYFPLGLCRSAITLVRYIFFTLPVKVTLLFLAINSI